MKGNFLLTVIAVLGALFLNTPAAIHAQSGDSTCYATGDLNQDGLTLSVSDLVEFVRLLADSTAQVPWYVADLNGDCVVDTADIRWYVNYFTYGPSIWPIVPIQTCCHPDITWICCLMNRGNVNGDTNDAVNVIDVSYLVNYLFRSGPPPFCMDEGNVNGDSNGSINVVDVTFLVNHLFKGGPQPPSCFAGMPF